LRRYIQRPKANLDERLKILAKIFNIEYYLRAGRAVRVKASG